MEVSPKFLPWDFKPVDLHDPGHDPSRQPSVREKELKLYPLSYRTRLWKQQLGRDVNRKACGDNGRSANSCFLHAHPPSLLCPVSGRP